MAGIIPVLAQTERAMAEIVLPAYSRTPAHVFGSDLRIPTAGMAGFASGMRVAQGVVVMGDGCGWEMALLVPRATLCRLLVSVSPMVTEWWLPDEGAWSDRSAAS